MTMRKTMMVAAAMTLMMTISEGSSDISKDYGVTYTIKPLNL